MGTKEKVDRTYRDLLLNIAALYEEDACCVHSCTVAEDILFRVELLDEIKKKESNNKQKKESRMK